MLAPRDGAGAPLGLVTYVVPTGGGLAKGLAITDVLAASSPLSVAASQAAAVETGWLPKSEERVPRFTGT